MKKSVCIVFISLAFISAAVHADDTTLALANIRGENEYPIQSSAIESMDSIRKKYAFDIVPESSSLRFQVDSPIGDIWVSIDEFEGSFSIFNTGGNSNLSAIEVNARSLDSDRGFVGTILRGEDFLDVENFPCMRFVGRSIEWYGNRYAVLKGYMTIRNATKEVTFYVELTGSEIDKIGSDSITVKATATIKRSEFGIYTLIPLVSDNVNLYINVVAVKQESSLSMVRSTSTGDQ